MGYFTRSVLLGVLLALAPVSKAQSAETTEPAPSELEEQVAVHLILLDTVVVDRAGRAVGGLTLDDFEIVVDGETVAVDTLDAGCDGVLDDPRAVSDARKRPPLPTDEPRKLVILVDYLHLAGLARTDVLENARKMVRHGMTDNDEVMVAALTLGLRIEQTFTSDRQLVEDVLERMEYDISLWNGDFRHLTEEAFYSGMQGLFNVLGTVPGHKGIVLFSNHPGSSDENDLLQAELSAAASSSRCSLYPVHAEGLVAARPG